MSDIFHEVDEEVRQEQLAKWWKKYGDYVIAGVSVLVIVVAGWKLWQFYEHKQQLKAASDYSSAMQISQAGQNDIAADAYAQIAKKAPGGYAYLAELSRADALMASGRKNDAIALYTKLAGEHKDGLGDVARIRAAWAQADTLPTAQLKDLLAPLNDGKSQWRFMAQELLAYRAYKDGNPGEAQKAFRALASEQGTPASVKQRADAMANFLASSGGADYGKVPDEKPANGAPQGAQQGTPSP